MVRTRIAPSPTGEDIHIGNLYTAYINWAVAQKNNGQFIIRIEDTDRLRLIEGSEEKILQSLKDYGVTHDEGPDIGGPYQPYRQSERLDIYKKYADELITKEAAYYCFCSKEKLEEIRQQSKTEKRLIKHSTVCDNQHAEERIKKGESYVIRLKVPDNQDITFNDLIRGDITINSSILDDQVLLKSDGFPTYHLGVVIDDYLMKITHIVRAEEWISSTPKHILLYKAFGWDLPIFAHVPDLRNPDKSKLSKRKNPVWAQWYLKEGFLPDAMLNFLALMGWSHPEEKEIFSREEFVKVFDLKDMQAVGPVFDRVKLEWMNGEYIRAMSNDDLRLKIKEFYNNKLDEEILEKSIPIIKERIKKLSDYKPLTEFLFNEPETYEIDLSDKKEILMKTAEVLEGLSDWSVESIGEAMVNVAKENNIKNGDYFMMMRVAITGKKISPPLNESMVILGKEKSIQRVQKLT